MPSTLTSAEDDAHFGTSVQKRHLASNRLVDFKRVSVRGLDGTVVGLGLGLGFGRRVLTLLVLAENRSRWRTFCHLGSTAQGRCEMHVTISIRRIRR